MKVLEKNQTKILETEKLLREIITTPVEFIDDEGHFHPITDTFLAKNFVPTSIPKNFRHV